MALERVFNIAGSALGAESVRLNTVASNLANADTVSGSPNDIYRAREPVFASMLNEQLGGGNSGAAGVQVTGIVESGAAPRAEYRPDHPAADADGYVYYSNVNVMEELANLISASRSYETNVDVMTTTKQLLLKTLELGR
ncbi:flagellar basal-body rod protein FlgC [Thioflavicoccus mobilis 8321]|uniref:Flagellar basal-body rod protein FlgC n=1 Tax=Thioflavicoccus mobilis 8321 TaxID=765912 RepID=L0H3J5_9GAMM|nr:flagellar basal body rod protein FlgC [Thioflavicoccus mobilis]AGA92164.1 flagellar basal-body rod protein FlgC [Thioflavicoccus mobilis 8321]